jgi:hypothetical protein
MKIMLNHSSAKRYEETPHITKSTKNKTSNLNGRGTRREETPPVDKSTKNKTRSPTGASKTTISNALKQRARSVIKDRSIDAQSRALIRYGLETNDPWLAELVRRADAGETIIFTVNSLKHPHPAKRIQAKKRLKH